MPNLMIYHSNDDLPAAYECQARAAVRMLWHDAYTYDIDAPLIPPERHPQHIVVANRHALISYARVVWVTAQHAGQTWKVYALGDVFTYPAFRKQGYGRQVVDAASRLIQSDADADIAILFTDPVQERFYAAGGWETVTLTDVTIGDADSPEPHPYFSMMQFLSARARASRGNFETQPLYLPGYGW